MAPSRRMCTELVWELCKEIPIVNTHERILLTSHNINVYLAPRFHKMRLIYRDAIEVLKAMVKAKQNFCIDIEIAQNKESEPIVVIDQEQWVKLFKLKTNKFIVYIQNYKYRSEINILDTDGHFESAHLLYFLRLITPLVQPIQLRLDNNASRIPFELLSRFMNTQSDWIDSIAIWSDKFDSEPIYRALNKYNKLQIYGSPSPNIVPKLIQWLINNNNNNGQSKKYLVIKRGRLDNELTLLMDELKQEFSRATRKRRFVVRLELDESFAEFTLCNELTGEKLQLRFKNFEEGWHTTYIYALSRFPNNGIDDNENDCAKLDTCGTEINLLIT